MTFDWPVIDDRVEAVCFSRTMAGRWRPERIVSTNWRGKNGDDVDVAGSELGDNVDDTGGEELNEVDFDPLMMTPVGLDDHSRALSSSCILSPEYIVPLSNCL